MRTASRPALRLAAIAAVIACLGPLAGAAFAEDIGFAAPGPISPPGLKAKDPQLAIDGQGTRILVWLQQAERKATWRLHTRRIQAGGEPGPVVALSPQGKHARHPRLAVGPGGTATVVWWQGGWRHGRIRAVQLSPEGVPGPLITVAGRRSVQPELAVDGKGRVTVAWWRVIQKDRIAAARISPEGVVGPRWELARNTERTCCGLEPPIGIASDQPGNSIVAWTRGDYLGETASTSVEAVRISADGQPGDLWALDSAEVKERPDRIESKSFYDPMVGFDGSGGALLAWTQSHRVGNRTLVSRVAAAQVPADGDPGARRVISDPDDRVYLSDLETNGAGSAALLAQTEYDEKTGNAVQLIRVAPNGSASEPVEISPPGELVSWPQLALDNTGVVTAEWEVWQEDPGTQALQVTRVDADGHQGKTTGLPVHYGARVAQPQIALDPAGLASLAWTGGWWDGKRVEWAAEVAAP